jgi:predicted GNAT family acetyltransferase
LIQLFSNSLSEISGSTRSVEMKCIQNACAGGVALTVLGLVVGISSGQSWAQTSQPPAKNEIKILDNPGGGQYAFGTLTSQSNKADALVYMLHQVHGKFGDKPQVGKLFQSKDGNSLATFFALTAKNMGGSPVTGLVIITQHGKNAPQMGILYDDSRRFVKTEPAMLKAVSAAWQAAGSPAGRAGGGIPTRSQEPAAPLNTDAPEKLYPATGGDRSVVINLPPGWHITSVAGGSVSAEGTHGEMLSLQSAFQQIIDPRNPRAQSLMNGGMAGRGPKVVCPLGPNLFEDYVCVVNQNRRNNGKPPATYNLTSATPQPGLGEIRPLVVLFTVDLHDGMGPRNGSGRLDLMGSAGATWALGFSMSNIPQKYASSEAATLKAVVASYRRNESVISAENAGVMERIRQQGIANQQQADAINQRRESNKQSFEGHMQTLKQNDADLDAHMGNIDWQSKITQDYILDRSVVKDVEYDGTATVGNRFADALVKANPYKFEIVQNADLIRGRDY